MGQPDPSPGKDWRGKKLTVTPVKKETYMYVRDKLQATDEVTKLLDDFQGFGLRRG